MFLISQSFAQKYWVLLVVYTEVVILFQFFWQFSPTDGVPSDNILVVLFGIKYFDNFWLGLAFHLSILAAAWLQLRTFRFLEKRVLQERVASSLEGNSEDEWKVLTNQAVSKLLASVTDLFESLFHNYILGLFYLVLLLSIFLEKVDLMDIT
jgi:hypothetical protein